MTNLVAEVSYFALLDDHVQVRFFRRIELLINCIKSDADDNMKPQSVINKWSCLTHAQVLTLSLALTLFLLQNRLRLKMSTMMIRIMLTFIMI